MAEKAGADMGSGNDKPNSQASSREKIFACGGLVMFGLVAGLVAVFSEKSGTAISLLGLLFGLLGGSLVALFTNPRLDEKARCQLGFSIGLISVGVVLGILAGFGLQLAAGSTGARGTATDSPWKPVIHAGSQDELRQLTAACKTTLEKIDKTDPNREKFERLDNFLRYLQRADSNAAEVEKLIQENPTKYDFDGLSLKLKNFREHLNRKQ